MTFSSGATFEYDVNIFLGRQHDCLEKNYEMCWAPKAQTKNFAIFKQARKKLYELLVRAPIDDIYVLGKTRGWGEGMGPLVPV